MSSRPIPRVSRMMDAAKAAGLRPVFAGAFRDEGLPSRDQWNGHPVVRLGSPFPLLNGKRPLTYVSSVAGYNGALREFLRDVRPRLVHCSDLETTFGALAAGLGDETRKIYNIHDNIAQRYSIPAPARWALNQLEGALVAAFDVTLTPEQFRREALPSWAQSKVQVVRNTPDDPGYTAPPLPDEPIRIFFGGWLDWGRGVEALIHLAAENRDFELRVAGEGSAEIIEKLKNAPRVRYLGFLDHAAIMAETAQCHVVPALYDPTRLINRFAASNKLAEALAVGRPILINSEMMVAAQFRDAACVLQTPYRSIATSAVKIRELVRSRRRYEDACREARSLYEQMYSWEEAQAGMRRAIGV